MHNYITELPCPYTTLSCCWSSVLKIPFSSSKISIFNRYMVQPWVFSLPPLWSTCLWKNLDPVYKHCHHPPSLSSLWVRYVDDTFVIQKAKDSHLFLQNINSTDPHIQFTAEIHNTDGSIPFLDTLVSPGPDNTLLTSVYGKPTHTDQYLQLDSHYSLSAKYSAFKSLTHRARTVDTNPKMLHKEDKNIKGALQKYKYPNWTFNRLKKSNHKYNRGPQQQQQQHPHGCGTLHKGIK